MDHNIEQHFANIPDIIAPPIEMLEANQKITIYEGEYTLNVGAKPIKIEGKIYFDWFPTIGAKFFGRIIENKSGVDFNSILENENNIEFNSLNFGNASISNIIHQNDHEIQGIIIGDAILGDKSINITKIKFAIPNLREFFGENVKVKGDGTVGVYSNRITLENDEFIIKIDKSVNYKEQLQSLKSRGGYIILYSGELEAKKKRNIDYKTSDSRFIKTLI